MICECVGTYVETYVDHDKNIFGSETDAIRINVDVLNS